MMLGFFDIPLSRLGKLTLMNSIFGDQYELLRETPNLLELRVISNSEDHEEEIGHPVEQSKLRSLVLDRAAPYPGLVLPNLEFLEVTSVGSRKLLSIHNLLVQCHGSVSKLRRLDLIKVVVTPVLLQILEMTCILHVMFLQLDVGSDERVLEEMFKRMSPTPAANDESPDPESLLLPSIATLAINAPEAGRFINHDLANMVESRWHGTQPGAAVKTAALKLLSFNVYHMEKLPALEDADIESLKQVRDAGLDLSIQIWHQDRPTVCVV
jgi:hypothetical protein